MGEDILHPIHNRDEGLHTRVTRHLDAVHLQLFLLTIMYFIPVHVTADNMRLQSLAVATTGWDQYLVSAEASVVVPATSGHWCQLAAAQMARSGHCHTHSLLGLGGWFQMEAVLCLVFLWLLI